MCYIDLYEEGGLDDESTQMFQIEEQLHYTQELHQHLKDQGFKIELDLFE